MSDDLVQGDRKRGERAPDERARNELAAAERVGDASPTGGPAEDAAGTGNGTRAESAATWKHAHAELVRLAATRARLDAEEGRWLVVALRAGTHLRLGYASFAEYVERLFGYSPRWTAEKLRVAEALEKLPEMSSAIRTGKLVWSIARELTRVATPVTESDWLAAARGRTARDVERLVSGHRPGSRPSDEPDQSVRRHVLRFEVSGETLANFREAMAKLRRDADGPLDDDAALLLMSRCVLGGPTDVGRASYQMAMTVCEACKRGRMRGRGELVSVDGEVVEMAACDAQVVATAPDTHVGAASIRTKQSIPPKIRRSVMLRDEGRCRVPGCRHAVFVDVHHVDPRADGGANDADNLVVLCSAHHRAVHRGAVVIEGRVSTGLVFRHADGTEYGVSVSPAKIAVATRAYRALRVLGFGETETKSALKRVATHVGHDLSTETLVRRALLELTQRRAAA